MTLTALAEGNLVTDGAGAAVTWAGLRALHVLTAGELAPVWYVAGDLGPGTHVVDISQGSGPHYRHLIRYEPAWWSVGIADVYGDGQTVLDAIAEPVPELLSTTDAAGLIPGMDRWGKLTGRLMSRHGIEHNIGTGDLYPLYTYTPARLAFLFAAQVRAVAARRLKAPDADELHQQWMAIRGLVPDAIRIVDRGYDVSPRPSVRPLPMPAAGLKNRHRPAPGRWTDAMMLAHNAGLIKFLGPADGAYVADVVGFHKAMTRRAVPGEHVLPWLLGVADGRDTAGLGVRNADVIAYREWLG